MSIEIIKDTEPKANKDYPCDACQVLLESMVYPDDFTPDEVVVLRQAELDGWKVKKGQTYSRQVNKIDGDLNVFISRTNVLPIYFKYDMNDGV